MTEVIIVSHHPVFRQGLQVMLSGSSALRVAAIATALDEQVAEMCSRKGYLLLVDFDKSIDLKVLRRACAVPGCHICLVVHDLPGEFIFQLRELGVAGIISTRRSQIELLDAISGIARGELYFDPSLTSEAAPAEAIRLSPREGQLIELLTRGLKNKEIATQLNITEGTVKVYLSKLFQKVGAKDRFDLALSGLKNLGSAPGPEDGAGQPTDGASPQGLRKFVTPHARPRDGQPMDKSSAA